MYHLKIEIIEANNKTKLIYEAGLVSEQLKAQIKQHKKEIMERIKENEAAFDRGFLVYQHGQFYEYQYGRGSFLYIERVSNGKAVAWRANYLPEQKTPYKTKMIAENVPFSKAYKEATGFIDWLNKRRGKKMR
jgi:hypothetical protein